ncbi:hypothetical protein [Streptomyces olivaceus]|uniref:hypothetical protein n=1 Tax=Streptomyces olivaceus TaxID=47716 RepID=UPI001CCECEC1|nr:hypothetical protein [Streptomyces olivaceus]MBZ6109001.1 hypothetical protein [Streptomyces olivaceus]MBZ6124072.1 hypothetical protein [Streptomyces olivaceus]MBZ6144180.1 hypothetical protein [Streptomyces olivaceus]MBZ6158020.1 hypothetical protein [Streptomyces olivaceus]MBZ6185816.1 hypothetical protein [Streptomyces olivaceus]
MSASQAPVAADLAATDDLGWAVRLLAATPTHEHRDPELLRRWARAADAFGAALAPVACTARVVESEGGLELGLLARYGSRPPTVELFTDTIELAERTVDARGWRHWYPPGSVRAAALAHEAVHVHLHHGPAKAALKHALGHSALRLGRLRVPGHVAGAEEVAAHAYARTVCGLGRSPLLLTAALAAEAEAEAGSGTTPPPARDARREN